MNTRIRKSILIPIAIGTLIFSTSVYAQPGGSGGSSRPSPSASGGNVGSPGMSGQAMNAGMQGSGMGAPAGGGGQLGGGGGQPGGGGNRPGGGDAGGQLPQGGGPNGGPNGGPMVGGDGAPAMGGPKGGGPNGGPMLGGEGGGPLSGLLGEQGGGFMPPMGEGGAGFAARFGGRESGGANLPLAGLGGGEGPLAQIGGFGTGSQGGLLANLNADALEGAPWHRGDGETPSNLPAAPAALSDMQSAVEAQVNVQEAVEQAQGGEQVEQAAEAAQAAYDEVWDDYYDAVDYTADTYYDTVTASADYMLQTYEEAVDYTTDSIDYYIDYYEQYAAYCAAYPWDCYSYSYDVTTNTYVYVGEVSSTPVSTTTVGEVAATTTYPVQSAPAPSAEAYEALVVFANDQLGAVVEPLYAGVATDNVQNVMSNLPAEMEAYLLNSMASSAATYWGLLNGGVAAVAIGDCATGTTCTVNSDTLELTLSSASTGAYGLIAASSMPTTADEALALITRVYPKLEGLAFSQITDIETGMAFTATAAGLGLDPETQQPLSVAKVVYAGVVDFNGQPFVYTLVAVGENHVALATS